MDQSWFIVRRTLGCWVAIVGSLVIVGAEGLAVADEMISREGRHISLTTDLDSIEEVETLVTSFDAAVLHWAQFWKIPETELADWKVTAFVMQDKPAFQAAGLISARVPNFRTGYALGNTVWVMAQPSPYYTRHLLLHEGSHSLAFHHFGGAGPTWYMEGSAEMLATHRQSGPAIRPITIPANKDEVPYWGRFKKMNELRREGRVPPIEEVMKFPPTLSGDVQAYSWSWAAASMFMAYPEYRKVFEAAAKLGHDAGPNFNRQFYGRLAGGWPVVAARWNLAAHELDFGFDWDAERVDIAVNDPLWDGRSIKVSVAADRGWQSIGVRIPAGASISLVATGSVTLADDPKPWTSFPAGVTIDYHAGRPIGELVACVLPNQTIRRGALPPLDVRPVGDRRKFEVASHSWLLLRVNDAVGQRGDNRGSYEVTIEQR